jgi:hypothetical protein
MRKGVKFFFIYTKGIFITPFDIYYKVKLRFLYIVKLLKDITIIYIGSEEE